MKPAHDGMKVSIMGREFVVACPIEEAEALGEAADYLDERMKEVQQSGRVVGLERCAVMAALNIAHELLSKDREAQITKDTQERVRLMSEKIATVMDIDMSHETDNDGATTVSSNAGHVSESGANRVTDASQDSNQAAI